MYQYHAYHGTIAKFPHVSFIFKASPDNVRANILFPPSPFGQAASGSPTTGRAKSRDNSLFDLAPKASFGDSVNLAGTGLGPDQTGQFDQGAAPATVDPRQSGEGTTGQATPNGVGTSSLGKEVAPSDVNLHPVDKSGYPNNGQSKTVVGLQLDSFNSNSGPQEHYSDPNHRMKSPPTAAGNGATSSQSPKPRPTQFLEGATFLSGMIGMAGQAQRPLTTAAPSSLYPQRGPANPRRDQSISELFFAKQQGNPAAAMLPTGGFKKEFDSSLRSDNQDSFANSVGGGSPMATPQSGDPYGDSDYYYTDSDTGSENRYDKSDTSREDSRYDYDDYQSDDNSEDQYGAPYYDYNDDYARDTRRTDAGRSGDSASDKSVGNTQNLLKNGNTIIDKSNYGNDNDRDNYKFTEFDKESNSGYSLDRSRSDEYGDASETPGSSNSQRQLSASGQQSSAVSAGRPSGYIENYNPGRAGGSYSDSGESDNGYTDYRDSGYSDSAQRDNGYNDYRDSGYSDSGESDNGYNGNRYIDSGYSDSAKSDDGYTDYPNSGYSDSAKSDDGYTDYPDSGYSNSGQGDNGYTDYRDSGNSDSAQSDNGYTDYRDSGYSDSAQGDNGYTDYRDSGYSDSAQSDNGYNDYRDSGESDNGYTGNRYMDSGYSDSGRSDKDESNGYSDNRYSERDESDKVYSGNRYSENGDSNNGNSGNRYSENGDSNNRYNDNRFSDSGDNDNGYSDNRYNDKSDSDNGYSNNGYVDNRYSDGSDSNNGYIDNRYSNSGDNDDDNSDNGYNGKDDSDNGYIDRGNINNGYVDNRYSDSGNNDKGYSDNAYSGNRYSDSAETDNGYRGSNAPALNTGRYTGTLDQRGFQAGVSDPGPPPKDAYAGEFSDNLYRPGVYREPEIATSVVGAEGDARELTSIQQTTLTAMRGTPTPTL
ncbi:hypothetical protein EGW08_008297 [Elysia chlorotica]|uniref:Uncharacterized protein n=1 Tax=Elysia chlorotica TaxID=188477 RepID=A0A3S1HQ47_ELYCH|nr:hypothetical protein EGW08_008297 [Elysia chlorotica]